MTTIEGTKEKKPKTESTSVIVNLMKSASEPPKEGDFVEGSVIAVDRSSVFIDLRPFGIGIIFGREFMSAREIVRKISIGDIIAAKVIDPENENGYIELSLREARQAMIWGEADKAIKSGKTFEITVKEANKGGLMVDWQGITGFLPASQLKTEHYPRVLDGDKDKILGELKKLVGEKITVSIITADPKEGKLIFSEKDIDLKDKKDAVDKYKVGDVFGGEITGAVDFGVFVKIADGLEGLVHISELDWGLVEDPRAMFKVGEKVDVKVIEVKDGKVSLSIKALKKNPWIGAEKKYKSKDVVDGVIIKFNQYGALAAIEEGVSGLVHVSEFETGEKLKEALELGKSYKFKINIFEPKQQKMTLVPANKKV